jgi:DNA polymerase-1
MKKRKVILVDGNSLAYRAFFALPDTMTTRGGQPTNAVYGFTSMLLKVVEEESPDAVVVAFDGPRSELKRTMDYPEYKAHRPTMPDDLRAQMEMIDRLLEAMRIPSITAPGFEADDILGTLASRVKTKGDEAVIVTGDKDTLQLADQGIRILMTARGITETETFDPVAVERKYGIAPDKIPDFIGLKGDSSDNIPGVPGIGEKGASKLIRRFGSLEKVYENLDEISGTKTRQSLEDNRETAILSKELATIDTDVPIELDPGEITFGEWERHEVLDYMSALEFQTLARRFLEMFGGSSDSFSSADVSELAYSIVDADDRGEVESFVEEVESGGEAAVMSRLEGDGYCGVELRALAIANADKVLIASFAGVPSGGPAVDAIRRILGSSVKKSFNDSKPTCEAIDKAGLELRNVNFDAGIAGYLENPSLGTYYLWDLWEKNVGKSINIDGKAQKVQEQDSLLADDDDEDDLRLATEAAQLFHLEPRMEQKLADLGMSGLFENVEMPLMIVLKDMETTGVALDTSVIDGMKKEVEGTMDVLEHEIYVLAGREFNIGSPKQLAKILFEEMGIPPLKKTKTGYSTDSSVLEKLSKEHPIAEKLIEYREHSKLKSTYLDVLPALICPATGRVHCSFNQMATATGRISSSHPNLQNIPVRTEFGRRIRAAFVPGDEGDKILVADYSQIELRVLAHMSGDELLLDAFAKDADIHTETAAKIFYAIPDDVTTEQRRMAKVVNFGVVYGMGYYGLSTRLGISLERATDFIDTYFERYEGVRKYREDCIEQASRLGYAETLLGRRRYIPQLSSDNRQARELGERIAINTPLQGSAADIMKKAMVDVAAALREEDMRSRMTLQVHDELMFEVAPAEVDRLVELVKSCMSGAFELKVPLSVEIGAYENWGQAK